LTGQNIPYTHWAYFPDEASAKACAAELGDFVTRIRPPWEDVPEWLLLAGRDVAVDDVVQQARDVAAIVERHGGFYDGGESTYTESGDPVADPMLTGEWDVGKGD
jgi:hypothetical protein